MQNYLEVGYSNIPHLAPDNFVGRWGAEIYEHTDDGFGGGVFGALGTGMTGAGIGACVSSIVEAASLSSIIWSVAILVPLVPLFLICLLTILSLAYVRVTRIPGEPTYDRYGYPIRNAGNDLKKIAEASETYRRMNRNDRKTFRPVIRKMRSLASEGEWDAACKRADKFNETRKVLNELIEANKTVDNSDLEEMDALIKGMQEIRAERKALDTKHRAGVE